MAYVDLGKYAFTTGPDYTQLNPGNLTSILSLSTVRVPYFEMYRLLINTAQVPSGLPGIVQATGIVQGSSLTALDLTFGQATTKGNTVIVGYANSAATTNPSVSGITLGGSADHFGAVASAGSGADFGYATLWADPDTGEAATALAVTTTGGTGTVATGACAWEVSGLLATSSATRAVDVSGSATVNGGAPSATTSGGATSAANDFQAAFGIAADTETFTFSGPGNWVNASIGPLGLIPGAYLGYLASTNLAGVKGSPGTYTAQGTQDPAWFLTAASLFQAAGAAAQAFPFTVAIDGVTWDSEATVAGVGYTYNIGQSPLYLNPGQTLQILWNLPSAQYAAYAGQFNITGWFRYDPTVQPS